MQWNVWIAFLCVSGSMETGNQYWPRWYCYCNFVLWNNVANKWSKKRQFTHFAFSLTEEKRPIERSPKKRNSAISYSSFHVRLMHMDSLLYILPACSNFSLYFSFLLFFFNFLLNDNMNLQPCGFNNEHLSTVVWTLVQYVKTLKDRVLVFKFSLWSMVLCSLFFFSFFFFVTEWWFPIFWQQPPSPWMTQRPLGVDVNVGKYNGVKKMMSAYGGFPSFGIFWIEFDCTSHDWLV